MDGSGIKIKGFPSKVQHGQSFQHSCGILLIKQWECSLSSYYVSGTVPRTWYTLNHHWLLRSTRVTPLTEKDPVCLNHTAGKGEPLTESRGHHPLNCDHAASQVSLADAKTSESGTKGAVGSFQCWKDSEGRPLNWIPQCLPKALFQGRWEVTSQPDSSL